MTDKDQKDQPIIEPKAEEIQESFLKDEDLFPEEEQEVSSNDDDNPEDETYQAFGPVEPKRNKLRSLLVWIILGALIGTIGYRVFFKRSSLEQKLIHRESVAVARIDLMRLADKADLQEMKSNPLMKQFEEQLKAVGAEQLLTQPGKIGFDFRRPSYLCVKSDANEQIVFQGILPVYSSKKVKDFFTGIGEKSALFKVETEGKVSYAVLTSDAAMAWNNKSFVFTAIYGSMLSATELKEKCITALSPAKEDQNQDAGFKASMKDKHDFAVWFSNEKYFSLIEKGLTKRSPEQQMHLATGRMIQTQYGSYPNQNYYYQNRQQRSKLDELMSIFEEYGGGFEKIMAMLKNQLTGSSTMLYFDFEKGKIVMGYRTFMNDIQKKTLKNITKDVVKVDKLRDMVPGKGLLALFGIQFNYKAMLQEMIAVFPEIKNYVQQAGEEDMWTAVETLCDGSALVSMNSLGEVEEPLIIAVISMQKNKGLQAIIDRIAGEGLIQKEGNIYQMEDIVLIMDEETCLFASNADAYKALKGGLSKDQFSRVNKAPFAFHMDLQAISEIVPEHELGMSKEDFAAKFKELKFEPILNSGMPDEYKLTLGLTDTKTNGLKTLVDLGLGKGY